MKNFRNSAFIACGFFTFGAIVYTGALALFVNDSSGNSSDIYKLIFRNIFVLLAYSVALGALSSVLKTKLAPAVKRVIHAVALYLCTLGASLLMANPGEDARQIVLFIFMCTLLYVVVYIATLLVLKLIKKIRE